MDEWSDAESRPLRFPLADSEVIETETPDDAVLSGVFVWPDDPNERTLVLFELSQHEYTALASAVDVGRDIAFGKDSTKLWWLWIRNMVQVPQICAMMIDCITNDDDVKNALIDAVLGSQQFRDVSDALSGAGNPLSTEDMGTELADRGCEEDTVFGIAVAIVDAMDNANTDLIERIEAGTNPEEKSSLLFQAVPIIETLPFDEILDFADMAIENLAENYASQMTEDLKHEIACDLFCIMLDNADCKITFGEILEYFSDKLGADIDQNTLFRQGVAYLAGGTWFGNQVVYAFMLTQAVFWRWAGNFVGINLASLAQIARSADTDGGWTDCDCAPPPENCLDFTAGEQDVVPAFTGSAQYTPDNGWGNSLSAGVGLRFADSNAPSEITKLRIVFYRSWDGATSNPYYDLSIGQVESATGTAGTVQWGFGADQPHSGQEIIVEAPSGTHWNKEDLIMQTWASSQTWPGIGANDAPQQWVSMICFNDP